MELLEILKATPKYISCELKVTNMSEFVGRVYNRVAEENLEELREDIGHRTAEKYTVEINTGEPQ